MSEYYAVIRSTDHLAHYGVKGMKWGVRKAIALGDSKKLNKEFNKAAKKLAKLQDKALNSKKYAAKAAAYGAAAAGTGTLAIGGTGLAKKGLKSAGTAIEGAGRAMLDSRKHSVLGNLMRKTGSGMSSAGEAIEKWGNKGTSLVEKTMEDAAGKKYIRSVRTGMKNDTKFRIGSGLAALGLGAASARNAYIAANSNKYLNKASNFKQAMDDTFAGTKYSGQYVAIPKVRKTSISRKRRKKS